MHPLLLTAIGVGLAVGLIFLIPQLPVQNRLIDCCDDDDISKLRKKLDDGGDPNRPGWFGLTPLIVAVRGKRFETVRLLLERGANPNGTERRTLPLAAATESNDLQMAQILMEAGALPLQGGLFGATPFEQAVENGDEEMVRMMIRYGATGAAVNSLGDPIFAVAVASAAREKKPEILQKKLKTISFLLDHGAHPNMRYGDDFPLVSLALPNVEVLRLLVDRGAITDVAWDGVELEEVIRILLEPEPN